MRTTLTIACFFFTLISFLRAQPYQQFFDGADTNVWSSLFVVIDSDSNNVWQIGKPQKIIFDSAATAPNVIVTDTVNYYPPNNNSIFIVGYLPWASWGILAVRWSQKLDLDTNKIGRAHV